MASKFTKNNVSINDIIIYVELKIDDNQAVSIHAWNGEVVGIEETFLVVRNTNRSTPKFSVIRYDDIRVII